MNVGCSAEDVDLSDPAFWGRTFEERDRAFATLRRDRPVAHFAEPQFPIIPPGPGYWAITRYADVVEASRDPLTFSSASGSLLADLPAGVPFSYLLSMIDMDSGKHDEMRQLVGSVFTPRSLQRLVQRVEDLCEEIVNQVVERGECDLAADIATPLPLRVVLDMLGVPRADWAWIADQALIAYGRDDPELVPGAVEQPMVGALATLEMAQVLADYAKQLCDHKRAHPADDLASRLATATLRGRRLTDEQLAQWFILLLVAGAETTRQAISHGVLMLARHPDQGNAWRADFDGLARTAVEELVRWTSPVIAFRRTVTRDTTLGGQELKAGEKVMLYYPSANRDERAFHDPYRFDLRRDPNPHVGFGGPGPHFCLGAHLARREISVAFKTLFDRMPDLEVVSEPKWLRSSSINGIKHLNIRFTPSTRRGRR